MAQAGKKRVITIVQIVLAALVLAGGIWLAYKFVSYSQAQKIYGEMEAAYASEISDDPGSVAFDKLTEDYPNAVAWLKMDDVDVSYPIMKGEDNDFYLYNGPDGEPNIDGSVFLDYRTKSLDNDLYSIIYGHNMLDESMFGQLDNYVNEDFYRKGTGAFTVLTPKGAYRYKIFAANIVDPASPVYQMGFKNPRTFDTFVKQLKDESMYDTGVDVVGSDCVVTLSTCSAENRLVLSAKRL